MTGPSGILELHLSVGLGLGLVIPMFTGEKHRAFSINVGKIIINHSQVISSKQGMV